MLKSKKKLQKIHCQMIKKTTDTNYQYVPTAAGST